MTLTDAGDSLQTPSAETPADAWLISASIAGDRRAFNEIVRRYTPRVFGYALHMTRHRQDAEDVAQQSFLKAYLNLASFDLTRPFIAWLLTITRRTALNHLRDTRRFEPTPEALAATGPSPAGQVEKKDRLANLWARARQELSPRDYEIMWLHYGEDMSLEDTARIVGLTQTHTKIITFRARQRLSKLQSAL